MDLASSLNDDVSNSYNIVLNDRMMITGKGVEEVYEGTAPACANSDCGKLQV